MMCQGSRRTIYILHICVMIGILQIRMHFRCLFSDTICLHWLGCKVSVTTMLNVCLREDKRLFLTPGLRHVLVTWPGNGNSILSAPGSRRHLQCRSRGGDSWRWSTSAWWQGELEGGRNWLEHNNKVSYISTWRTCLGSAPHHRPAPFNFQWLIVNGLNQGE